MNVRILWILLLSVFLTTPAFAIKKHHKMKKHHKKKIHKHIKKIHRKIIKKHYTQLLHHHKSMLRIRGALRRLRKAVKARKRTSVKRARVMELFLTRQHKKHRDKGKKTAEKLQDFCRRIDQWPTMCIQGKRLHNDFKTVKINLQYENVVISHK